MAHSFAYLSGQGDARYRRRPSQDHPIQVGGEGVGGGLPAPGANPSTPPDKNCPVTDSAPPSSDSGPVSDPAPRTLLPVSPVLPDSDSVSDQSLREQNPVGKEPVGQSPVELRGQVLSHVPNADQDTLRIVRDPVTEGSWRHVTYTDPGPAPEPTIVSSVIDLGTIQACRLQDPDRFDTESDSEYRLQRAKELIGRLQGRISTVGMEAAEAWRELARDFGIAPVPEPVAPDPKPIGADDPRNVRRMRVVRNLPHKRKLIVRFPGRDSTMEDTLWVKLDQKKPPVGVVVWCKPNPDTDSGGLVLHGRYGKYWQRIS